MVKEGLKMKVLQTAKMPIGKHGEWNFGTNDQMVIDAFNDTF